MKFDQNGTSNLTESQKFKSDIHLFSLLVPLLNPGVGADGLEVLGEEVARLIVLTLHFRESAGCKSFPEITNLQLLTTVEVDVVLPAVSCLVLVGEPEFECKICSVARVMEKLEPVSGHLGSKGMVCIVSLERDAMSSTEYK